LSFQEAPQGALFSFASQTQAGFARPVRKTKAWFNASALNLALKILCGLKHVQAKQPLENFFILNY